MIRNRRMLCLAAAATVGGAILLAGCGANTATTNPPNVPPPNGVTQGEHPEAHHHRNHHPAGVAVLIMMSLKDLDLSADQKAAVEKIHADLHAKMGPVHEAGQEFSGVLADGVAAGAVDRAKADAAIEKVVLAAHTMHEASLDALNQLHAALNKEQRAALLDKMHARFEHWKEAHGRDEHPDHAAHAYQTGPIVALQKDLGLSQDQVEKIRANFKAEMTQHPQDHEHKEVREHMKSFAEAWKSDSFDAKTLGNGKDAAEKMARFAATRMARVFEAAAPVLTPDQRAKLSSQIRERATHKPA